PRRAWIPQLRRLPAGRAILAVPGDRDRDLPAHGRRPHRGRGLRAASPRRLSTFARKLLSGKAGLPENTGMGFDLPGLLAARDGTGYELWARHMNPQMARMLHAIGFDKVYQRADGCYLFDAEGQRYL